MSKQVSTTVMDAALDYIANNCVRVDVCIDTATPTDLTNSVASTSCTSSDFTKAAGDTSGRKVTFAGKSSITVNSTGYARHIVLSSSGGANLHVITFCDSQQLTQGNTVTIPAFKFEINSAS